LRPGPSACWNEVTAVWVAVSSSVVSTGAHHSINLAQLSSRVGNGSRGRLSSLPNARVAPGLVAFNRSGVPGVPQIKLGDRGRVDAADILLDGGEPVVKVGVDDGCLIEEEQLDLLCQPTLRGQVGRCDELLG